MVTANLQHRAAEFAGANIVLISQGPFRQW
jgi:hypothetical protein